MHLHVKHAQVVDRPNVVALHGNGFLKRLPRFLQAVVANQQQDPVGWPRRLRCCHWQSRGGTAIPRPHRHPARRAPGPALSSGKRRFWIQRQRAVRNLSAPPRYCLTRRLQTAQINPGVRVVRQQLHCALQMFTRGVDRVRLPGECIQPQAALSRCPAARESPRPDRLTPAPDSRPKRTPRPAENHCAGARV